MISKLLTQNSRTLFGYNVSDGLNNKSVYENLCSHEATIALVGLGYVGLPIALEFATDFRTIGYDINETRVSMMKNSIDPSGELDSSDFYDKNILFTSDAELLNKAEVKIVAVPTPVDANNNPDLTPITKACTALGHTLKKGNIVVFESTVYPGCTEEVCIPILEKISGLTCNADFWVGYSPERINPGDKTHTLTNITKIVSGSDSYALEEIYHIYNHVIDAGIHRAPSIKVAEAAKIVENTQRDVNIALMNELSIFFEKQGINTHEVLEAAGTKWNFLNFYPGLVGGHCIGVDPYYLIHKAKEYNVPLNVISSSRRINDDMPNHVFGLVKEALSAKGKEIGSSKILILGTTFKENVSDLRNSKAAELCQIFNQNCDHLDIVDPHAQKEDLFRYYGLCTSEQIQDDYDVIIYAVNHSEFETIDWSFIDTIKSTASVVVDFKHLLGYPQDSNSVKYITL